MDDLSLGTLLVVAVIGLMAPLLVNLAPALRLPAVVLEILLGVIIGPSGFDWVEVDVPTSVLSLFGLGFLLFLAGLEIDPRKLRRGMGRVVAAFGISLLLGGVAGVGLEVIHETTAPLFIAVALVSTSLGLVVPVLRDAGETDTPFGQIVLGASSIAEFGSILLVSLFFSQDSSSTGATVALLVGFVTLVLAAGLLLGGAGRSLRVSGTLARLEETTAQLGVRVAIVLLAGFFVLASDLGLETILGAFVAGALLRIVDREEHLIHERFRAKVEAIGYGFLVPVFFVSTGLQFDADALFREPEHLVLVAGFLAALFVVRALPAMVLYGPLMDRRHATAAGLLQATSLTFPVVAAHLGRELDVFDAATAAALITAGLLSVIVFPPVALRLLGQADPSAG